MRFREYEGIAGVYVIEFRDGASYVGQSADIGERLRTHHIRRIRRRRQRCLIEIIQIEDKTERLRRELEEIRERSPSLNKLGVLPIDERCIWLTRLEYAQLNLKAFEAGYPSIGDYIRHLAGLDPLPRQSRAVAEANRRRARR